MILKKFLQISAVFFCITFVHAQKQGNIWYFGNLAGIDFNSGSPIALTNGQIAFPPNESHNEGSSAISDSSGTLLFYSDGMTLWNSNHQIMQNGTGLLGNFSSTQSSIIIPDPANPSRSYYLFTVSSGLCCGSDINDGLRYSKIDMCIDNSLGGVLQTEKNIKLVDTVAEKIAVTRHSNGTDYWILTHKFHSNEFWALHLSNLGIIDTVVTSIGTSHTGDIAGSQGQLKFSSNGQKIAIGASNGLNLLEIFDFDKETGAVSNHQSLNRINNGSIYGVEFSQDGSKLYALSSTFAPFGMDIGQYDLSNGNLTAINASLTSVYNETTVVTNRGLQIGPDGKIYTISMRNTESYISVISNPNILGAGCNYQDQIISLGGRQGSYSLPSFISGFDYSNEVFQCEFTGFPENNLNNTLSIYPNPFTFSTTLEAEDLFHNAFLTIYNSYNQLVKQIDNFSGKILLIDRNNLSSGVYFVHLTQNDQQIAVKKLIITD